MQELSPARRTVILATCCLSLLMVSMDVTIVNVALQAIRLDLHASLSALQWIIDAYTLVVASFLMLGGSLADRFGRRRIFQIGMGVFSIGSLLCSVAPTVSWLIAFRAVQALGGCMLNPVAMSIITHVFTDPKERARATGLWGAVVGISMALGPLVGGLLTQSIGWRAIFWVNLPFGAAAIVLTACLVPESRAQQARPLDPLAQLLVLIALAALTFAVIEGHEIGWGSAIIVGIFTLSALATVALLMHEARQRQPMLDVRFFRNVPFSCATLLAIGSIGAFSGFLFLNSLYLQETRGLSAMLAGLCTLPMALGMIVCSPLSGWLLHRYGARPNIVLCGISLTASALWQTQLAPDTPFAALFACYLLFGCGVGMVNATVTYTAVSGMPLAQAGLAAAIASTSRQIGAALGVALAGVITHARTATGMNFAEATHPVWWGVVVIGAAIIALGFLSTSRWAERSSASVAHLLREPASSGAAQQ
jgi:EmrB/QacA subfamily drug resistance transporter